MPNVGAPVQGNNVGNDGAQDWREGSAGGADQPPIFVPLLAEDVERRRQRRLIILSLVAIAILGAAGFLFKRSVDPIHAQESYDSGVRLLRIARYPQAELAFDRAISLKSDFAEAYLMRAKALVADGQTERSFRDFGKAIEMRPNDPQPLIARGMAYIEMKDYQASIVDANAAIALDTNLAAAYDLRGLALRAMGNLQGALTDFNRAVSMAPNAANYFDRGATYQMLGEHRLAIADFTEIIDFQPDASVGYLARAKSELAIGDVESAQQDHLTGRLIDTSR